MVVPMPTVGGDGGPGTGSTAGILRAAPRRSRRSRLIPGRHPGESLGAPPVFPPGGNTGGDCHGDAPSRANGPERAFSP